MRIALCLRIALLAPPLALASATDAVAAHDPTRTVTIYVHGFDPGGADRHGVYGEDVREGLADSVAAMVGLPTAPLNGPLPPNAVVGTTYYGDIPPAYYAAADRADVDAVTAQWGGGVPRYALIVAKHARHVLERSGAQQVNFVSASFGALVARWLIEKDVEGLASDGRIARWLTVEGVVAGNWVASHDELVDILAYVQPEPIDVLHMKYDWVSNNLHTPRDETSSPLLSSILVGHLVSTDDRGYGGALRDAMVAYGEYAPNDAVQAVPDARFRSVAPAARFQGRLPTCATFHADHLGLENHRSAWAEVGSFLTGTRRVTVTMTSARVANLHEPSAPWWDWRPAEVLFESRAFSPAAQARWGLSEPLSAHIKGGAAAPLVRYGSAGETKQFTYVIFDDFVVPGETQLRLELHAWELDFDPRYGVIETVQHPYHDDLGGGSVVVSTLAPGSYSFGKPEWSCQIEVNVFDYPFQSPVGVGEGSAKGISSSLRVSPTPARGQVEIALASAADLGATARLAIVDASGRTIRRMEGPVSQTFLWDGRDASGRTAPAGIYWALMEAAGVSYRGKITLMR